MKKGKRKKLTDIEKNHLLLLNGNVCCVCKGRGIGINYHHIDQNPANNDPSNIAVLCVEDHDAHHRPKEYRESRHTELGEDKIRAYKKDWESFIAEAKNPHPQAIAVVNVYGNIEQIHSTRLIFQKVTGEIILERYYHLLDGPVEDWMDTILEEMQYIAPNLKLTLIDKPLPVEYCPCCNKSLSNTLD